jgi:hypothetical protein
MELDILTRDDLDQFQDELLTELQKLFSPLAPKQVDYLKGREVKKLLKISDSTLQGYRDTGKLQAKKVGGIYFYPRSSIENLFTNG